VGSHLGSITQLDLKTLEQFFEWQRLGVRQVPSMRQLGQGMPSVKGQEVINLNANNVTGGFFVFIQHTVQDEPEVDFVRVCPEIVPPWTRKEA